MQLSEAPEDRRVIRISSGQKLEGFGWSVFARKGFLAEWRQGRQVASVDLRPFVGEARLALGELDLPPSGVSVL